MTTNLPLTIQGLQQPITIAVQATVNQTNSWFAPTNLISVISSAIFSSLFSFAVAYAIYKFGKRARFTEMYINLMLEKSKSVMKFADIFIKLEQKFMSPKFIETWNDENKREDLKFFIQDSINNLKELISIQNSKELTEVVTFTIIRMKIVLFTPNVKFLRKIGQITELENMRGDLSKVHGTYLPLSDKEINSDALVCLSECNQNGFEIAIKNNPINREKYLFENKETFQAIRSFIDQYNTEVMNVCSNLNRRFI